MTGIYKIKNPNNKIYVGQSIDIEFRFNSYRKMNNCKNQIALKRSFEKYGVENHIFEVIEECDVLSLNERERYWQDFYNVIDSNGLNCKLTSTFDKSGKLSDETINKIKKWRSTQIRNPHTEETKNKISKLHKGKKLTEEHKEKLRVPKTEEHKEKLRGPREKSKKPKEKIECPNCKKIGAPHVMYRFHFDNCGIKPENKKVECPHCCKIVDILNARKWHFEKCKMLKNDFIDKTIFE